MKVGIVVDLKTLEDIIATAAVVKILKDSKIEYVYEVVKGGEKQCQQ